jgi:hypothetical protein
MKSSNYFFDEEFFRLAKLALKSYVGAYFRYKKLSEKDPQDLITSYFITKKLTMEDGEDNKRQMSKWLYKWLNGREIQFFNIQKKFEVFENLKEEKKNYIRELKNSGIEKKIYLKEKEIEEKNEKFKKNQKMKRN